MKAEVIAIGDEILTGQTIDTNSSFIAGELSRLGMEIISVKAIPDRREAVISALNEARGRSKVIIVTGGLGPTSDDITKSTLAEFFNTRLVLNREVLENITSLLRIRGVELNQNNHDQALVPETCKILMNRMGTAPGMWFEKKHSILISLPGVPYEMRHLLIDHVVPEFKERRIGGNIVHKTIIVCGIPEAHLAEKLQAYEAELPDNLKLAYLPSMGVIKLRLTVKFEKRELANKMIRDQISKLDKLIPEYIVSHNEVTLEEQIGILLLNKNLTISVAESCTGGNISSMIVSVPGSSQWLRGGVTAYSNEMKISLLKVPENVITSYGAVSKECASAMAEGIRQITGSDIGVATTGIAGPDGGTDEKPAGTLWIAVSDKSGTIAETERFGWDRNINIRRFSIAALNMLRKKIIGQI